MFTEPTDAQKLAAAAQLPRALPHLSGLYAEALKDLHAVIDHGTADPDRTLAAIATWREKQRRKDIRSTERQLAQVLIAAGEPGGAVCRGLGISRTRLQQEMRTLTEFAPLVPKGDPPIRKPIGEVRDAVA
ncbi:hypothetical protein [Mycobacterium aquaticum]|uniref:Uncharacterized protein n=1 Tax=Mycobacterium aquaticum TaxID=1927124 RepID=A0A1X0ABD6_9MYCO|nr:hypothetical protein [Mycobacterium aquaticum]ORA27371.1 hypothetical protein BST13_30395 [Mycobacterium aquaticum]